MLACAVAVLLAICLLQSFQIVDQKKELSVLQDKTSTNAAQIKALQATVTRLEALKSIYTKEIRTLSEQNSDLAAKQKLEKTFQTGAGIPPSTGKNSKTPLAGMLAEMMNDPDMKKAMQTQQAQLLKTMYAGLLKELNLTPEQNERFHQLLLDQQMQNMERGTALMSKDGDRAALTEQMKADREGMEAQMQELLGTEGFKQYKDYSQALPDRMSMDQFNKQFSDVALNDQQQQQLLQIMKEERVAAGLSDASQADKLNEMMSGGGMDKYLEQQKALNASVLAKASGILNAEQLQSFGTFQTNQLQFQQMGFKMAQKMWGSKTNLTSP